MEVRGNWGGDESGAMYESPGACRKIQSGVSSRAVVALVRMVGGAEPPRAVGDR